MATRMDSDHCQIVTNGLNGQKAVDQQTCASLAILSERLDRIKALGGAFADIEFSPDAKKMAQQKCRVAVC